MKDEIDTTKPSLGTAVLFLAKQIKNDHTFIMAVLRLGLFPIV